MNSGDWSWLEIAKLATSLFTPAALAVGGIYVHRITKRFEHTQWRSQKLIEKRLAVYDDMAPMLNDILCYFTYVGGWRDFDPPLIVSLKRAIDKKLHIAAPLFGDEFFSACMDFQNLCFKTFNAWGQDAKLRTQYERRRQSRLKEWNIEWNENFSADVSSPIAIQAAYKRVMSAFAEDIGVNSSFAVAPSGRVPKNIE